MRTTAREVALSPDDAIYQLFRHTSSPFIKRVITPKPLKLDRSDADLKLLFQFFEKRMRYQVTPTNVEEPYERRGLKHPPPPPTLSPKYIDPAQMLANMQKLPWMIDVFFVSILNRLRQSPGEFPEMVQELMVQFREDRVRIKLYDTYRKIGNFRELIVTLEEIALYPAPETFDLFCSALFVYYDTVLSAHEEKERQAAAEAKAKEEEDGAKPEADKPPDVP